MSNKLIKNDEEITSLDFFTSVSNTCILIGFLWIVLIVFIFSMPQDTSKYNVDFYFTILILIASIHILIGLVLRLLLRNSKFKNMISKDFEEFKKRHPAYFK